MSTLSERIADLSPEQRALLERQLLQRRTATSAPLKLERESTLPPLSFGQQRLWFLEQLEPNTPLFVVPAALRIHGALQFSVLHQVLNAICARHEVIRTTYVAVDGAPVCRVTPECTLDLPLVDLSTWSPHDRVAEVARRLRQEALRPFDLAKDLPFRATLLRLAADEHILLTSWHHIASDARSAAIFQHEFSALYSAFAAGRPSPFSELPVQYGDFARWQHKRLQGDLLKAQLAYWQKKLANSPASLELPLDRPRQPRQSYEGAEQSIDLPSTLVARLSALSRSEDATLFMTLLAAFNVLLYRYSGQSDILVGTPTAGRSLAETEALIGLFLNILVLRSDLSGEPTFRQLLGRVRASAREAYKHQELPFEKLVEGLGLERDLSRSPLFQVLFNFRSSHSHEPIADLVLEPIEIPSVVAAYELTLTAIEVPYGLHLQIEYKTQLFDAATIARMLGHFRVLLEAIAETPDESIATLPLLDSDERQQILEEWNDTGVVLPEGQTVVHLFESQVERSPEEPAFIEPRFIKSGLISETKSINQGVQLTYRELNRRSNQLAHYLQSLGVGPGIVVGVCLERSLDAVVAFLATLKVGGVYLPLDPTYPQARLAFMTKDASTSVLVMCEALVPRFQDCAGIQMLCLDTTAALLAQQPTANLPVIAEPNSLAYIIYTSGSTGQPKGAVIEHKQLVNRLLWMWQAYPFAANEVACQKTALSFVDSLWELLGPLLQGIPTVILPDEVVQDPERLVESLAHYRVSRLWLVPSLLRLLLDRFPKLGVRLPALMMWVATGEPLAVELLQRFQQVVQHGTLYNLYGTSEVWDATWYVCERAPRDLWRVPIGRPIANVRTYILDHLLQPVPIGVTGELFVGGAGVARGYINRPDLTTERFIRDSFHPNGGERLYRTGDLARYLPDGNIEYLGRVDQLLKLRGYRVEPSEIEACLRSHPQIRDAAVIPASDNSRLLAYIVPYEFPGPSRSELRTFLQQHLPGYMVPATFMFLTEMPLTPSGKVNRLALPMPGAESPEGDNDSDNTSSAPNDLLELQLKRIWEQLFEREVSIRDHFFDDLGGHSLLAARLFAQIEAQLGYHLPLATLFEAPTLEGLAARLRQSGWSPPWSSLVTVQPGVGRPPIFWVPAAGVTALSFVDLARHLGPDQPFYSLQPLGLDTDVAPHTSVAEMAKHYLQEIRALYPQGPYRLGGRCFGATVAFEMAQQLHVSGERVELLVMQDGGPPIPLQRSPTEWLRRAHQHWQHGVLADILWRHFHRRERMVRERIKRHAINVFGTPEARRLQGVLDAHLVAANSYHGSPYPGRIVLLWSSEFDVRMANLWQSGWEQLALGGVESYVVSGKHRTMLQEPDVIHLATQLRTLLDETASMEAVGDCTV